MSWVDDKVQEVLATVMRGVSGVRLGPGVLRSIIPIVSFGFAALAVITYALAAVPWIGLVAFILGLVFLGYVVERSFRFAEKNPLPALLGGAELLQLYRDQVAARDKSIIADSEPVIGGAIEHRKDGDV